MLAALDAPGVPPAAGVPGSAPRDSRVPLPLSAMLPVLRTLLNSDPEAPRLDGGAGGMRVPAAGAAPPAPEDFARSRAGAGAAWTIGSRGRSSKAPCPFFFPVPVPANTIPPEFSKSSRSEKELRLCDTAAENAGLPGPELVAQDARDCALVGDSAVRMLPPCCLEDRGVVHASGSPALRPCMHGVRFLALPLAGAPARATTSGERGVHAADTTDGTPLRL